LGADAEIALDQASPDAQTLATDGAHQEVRGGARSNSTLVHGGTTHSQYGPALVQVHEQCVPEGQRVSVRIPEQVHVQLMTAVRTGEKF
jgi:hypothetical protein